MESIITDSSVRWHNCLIGWMHLSCAHALSFCPANLANYLAAMFPLYSNLPLSYPPTAPIILPDHLNVQTGDSRPTRVMSTNGAKTVTDRHRREGRSIWRRVSRLMTAGALKCWIVYPTERNRRSVGCDPWGAGSKTAGLPYQSNAVELARKISGELQFHKRRENNHNDLPWQFAHRLYWRELLSLVWV